MRWLLLGCLVVFGGCQSLPPATILKGVTVVDGTGADPIANQAVVFRNGIIEAILPADRVRPAAQDEVLHLKDRWLVPGYVDLHVHFPPEPAIQDQILDRLAQFGITTLLNPGAREGAGVPLRNRVLGPGPRILTAGKIIESAVNTRSGLEWAELVTTTADVEVAIAAQAEAGVDFIKLYAGLPPDLVEVAIAESHRRGLKVIGHMGETSWKQAAEWGIDMLVHSGWGTPMDDWLSLDNLRDASDAEWYAGFADAPNGQRFAEIVDALTRKQVWVVPTLSITQMGAFGDSPEVKEKLRPHLAPEATLPGWWGEGWQRIHPYMNQVDPAEVTLLKDVYWPWVLNILMAMYRNGVQLGIGTDVGNTWMTPGDSFHYELELFAQAGIPTPDILGMATRNGALALGLEQEIGTIQVGKRADLVLLTADPTHDVKAMAAIEKVFSQGIQIWPKKPM